MADYKFTQDWFHWAPELWEKLVPLLPEREAFLELGSFEGRSTVWIVENMMQDGGFIDCVDTWAGGEEHEVLDMGAHGLWTDEKFRCYCLIIEPFHQQFQQLLFAFRQQINHR